MVPSFVLLTGTFAARGTRFGVAWDRTMTFIKDGAAYPIPETILMWIASCRKVMQSSTLDMLNEAIETSRTMQTNKFHKFIR